MGAKKKGKGSKLARMSEEERLRYLQHRAAIEEEARRRKEQLIATFMKNKLKHEEAFSRLNVAKINQQWRQTLRRYKCIELRQDLEALFKWFVHTASKKTKQIDVLLDDLDEAERQYARIYQCHMEMVDHLLGSTTDHMNEIQKSGQRQYEKDRKEIYEKATNEMNMIVSSCMFDQNHLKSILFLIEKTHTSKTEAMEAKQTVKADELRNEMLAEIENLVVSREAKIEQIWQNIQTVLREYSEATEDRRRQYDALRDQDFENCQQIFLFHQQINNTKEVITGLKEQLLKTRINSEERFEEMTKEKEDSCELFRALRKQLDNDREKDKKNLTFLATNADAATKALSEIHQKGEQIIQLLSLCKKLEVLRDKICPYIVDKTYLSEEQEKIIHDEERKFQEKLSEEIVTSFSKLNNFWKRYNQVLIEKEALVLNIKSLEMEQKELKDALRGYIAESMLGKPSTKIRVIIHRPFTSQVRQATATAEQRKVMSSIPCIEAKHSPSIRHMIRVQSGK